MLEGLGKIIKKTTDKIANAIFLDKNLVDTIIKDLQRALIEADVEILLIKEISDRLKKIAFDERIAGIEKKEHLIKSLHDELLSILGKEKKLELEKKQNKIMLIGLYGSGKTTTIAKIGNWFAKRGKKVCLVGLDVHRPAAKEQLEQLAQKNKLHYFIDKEEENAIKTWKKFKKTKEYSESELILIDSAGRHTLNKELIKEIKSLEKEISPTETILVIPADIGQAAKKQSQEFKEALKISGIIITRMDSSAKAGGAITACNQTQSPIYFLTTGEKINDLEEFEPESFLSRILGMGDLKTLVEKVKSITNEDEQKEMQERLQQGKISIEDVISQVKTMNTLGGFDKIKSLIPGFSSAKIPEEKMQEQQKKIQKWEHIVKSMTKEEKANPEILEKENSRVNRIAKGAGVNNSDVKSLIKQYRMLADMIKTSSTMNMEQGFSQKDLQKLMKKFGKRKVIRF